MRVALVGPLASGKTTLFSAITGKDPGHARGAQADLARVSVPDVRLDWLCPHYQPKKTTPAVVDYVDIPGLAFGARTEKREGKTEGEILGDIRRSDALAVVLPGYLPGSDPEKEMKKLLEEFQVLDFTVLEGRRERLVKQLEKPLPKEEKEKLKAEFSAVEAALRALEAGGGLPPELGVIAAQFQLLRSKPVLCVLNVAEKDVGAPAPAWSPQAVVLSAPLELELSRLAPEERLEFAREMGVAELALPRLIRLSYAALGLRTFFTVGEDEVRAWTIRAGETALAAAGTIHTDLARGFIRAEVMSYADLTALGSEKAVKEKGRWRLEGKDYKVEDGDILTIRFSV